MRCVRWCEVRKAVVGKAVVQKAVVRKPVVQKVVVWKAVVLVLVRSAGKETIPLIEKSKKTRQPIPYVRMPT